MMKEHEEQQLRTTSPSEVKNDDIANASSINTTNKPTTITSNDQLERCGKWLLSIPRDDVIILQSEKSKEYQDFILAFERLGLAHRQVICRNDDDDNHNKKGSTLLSTPETAKEDMASSSSSSRTSATSPTLSSSPSLSTAQQRSPSILSTATESIGSNNNNSSGSSISCYESNINGSSTNNKIPSMVSATTTTATTTTRRTVSPTSSQHQPQAQYNFLNFLLQHTGDDVILKIFEFLDCTNLQNVALTCTRFKRLAYKSATQRTTTIVQTRQLTSVMQLLRAQEQIYYGDYISTTRGGTHTHHLTNNNVRVPMLLLGRRLIVSNAGDPEYNGIYYCTTCNGNGYVFTKPRFPIQRVSSTTATSTTFVQQQDHEPQAGIGRVHMLMNNMNINDHTTTTTIIISIIII